MSLFSFPLATLGQAWLSLWLVTQNIALKHLEFICALLYFVDIPYKNIRTFSLMYATHCLGLAIVHAQI